MINIPEEVKKLVLTDGTRKNVRIIFPNGEYEDITNDSIVRNSVKFTESMCSQDVIRFGLTEVSSFECEVVGIENIKGLQIYVQIEIDCSSLGSEWCEENAHTLEDVDFPFYILGYGIFTVDSCQKQADMSHRRIVAYSTAFTDTLKEAQIKIIKDKIINDLRRGYGSTKYLYNPLMLALATYANNKLSDYEYSELATRGNVSELARVDFSTQLKTKYYKLVAAYKYATVVIEKTTEQRHYLFYCETKKAQSNTIRDIYSKVNNIISEFAQQDKKWISLNSITNYVKTRTTYSSLGVVTQPVFFDDYIYIQNEYNSEKTLYVSIPLELRLIYVDGTTETQVYSKSLAKTSEANIYNCNVDFDFVSSTQFQRSIKESKLDVDFTISPRNLIEGVLELGGKFGKFNRNGTFSIISPETIANLYPSETLFPSNSLFPQGTQGYSVPSTYTSAWYDELTKPYGRVQAIYKTVSNEEVLCVIDLVEDYEEYPDDYIVYDMSDNYIIRNGIYSDEVITQWLTQVAVNIRNIRYMPCEITSVGVPWLEAGDTVALETTDGDIIKTIILRRTLGGEQYLQDVFESR